MELQTAHEVMEPVNRTSVPYSPSDGEPQSKKEDLFSLKEGPRKVKFFRDYVGVGRAKKACREEVGNHGRFYGRRDGYEYVFDSDIVDECDELKLRRRMDLVFGIPSAMALWQHLIVLKELFIWTLENMEMMIIGSSIIKKF